MHMLALGWPAHLGTAAVLEDRALHDEDEKTRTTAENLRAPAGRPSR
jgi:hypothetical protein